MLFKTFKQKVFIDSDFLITVMHKSTGEIDSYFKVSYTNDINIDRVIDLYYAKAEMVTMCYNNAEKMNHITVMVKN